MEGYSKNMAKSSPSSLLHLVDDVVDVDVFCDFFLRHSQKIPNKTKFGRCHSSHSRGVSGQ